MVKCNGTHQKYQRSQDLVQLPHNFCEYLHVKCCDTNVFDAQFGFEENQFCGFCYFEKFKTKSSLIYVYCIIK